MSCFLLRVKAKSFSSHPCTVAYETLGHTYFVEDGLETKNIITGNLAAVTRELFVGLSTDATPSSYWLVNGDNYVANNIAAGSSHCAPLC